MAEPLAAPDNRTPISDAIKTQITEAFAAVPDGKRGALLVISDEHGARAMLAAQIGGHWKVALDGGSTWSGKPSYGAAIMGSW